MRRTRCLLLFLAVIVSTADAARAGVPGSSPFVWNDGDRVVLIGDTLLERDQTYGYFETRVTAANPDKTITFRNLAWSADTVRGLSRAAFDPPAAGLARLKENVLALKPTVLIVGYGMSESFEGEAGLPAFVSGLNALLDALSSLHARVILLSPIAHEDRGRPLPDPASHNRSLAMYRDALRKTAGERNAWFVDLYEQTLPRRMRVTDDGILPNAVGFWYLASLIDRGLGRPGPELFWRVRVGPTGMAAASAGVTIKDLTVGPTGARFRLVEATLPPSPAPGPEPRTRRLAVDDLAPGRYTLTIDGIVIGTADAGKWAKEVTLRSGPEFAQVEALRATINEKNCLYFYRWPPQNETYLFGFRKNEQGNNAREIPLFDPLVEVQEKVIAMLKKPVSHLYELKPESGVAK